MFARSDLNGWLSGFLGEYVDDVLHGAGFQRRAGARSARRRTIYGSQKIDFFIFSRPSYAPDKAHLTLNVTFHMPQLMELTRQIFGPNLSPFTRDDSLACNVSLGGLEDGSESRWLFQDRAALDALAGPVRKALASSVLPFVEASNTMASFVAGPARDRAKVQVVAAAYVQLGREQEASDFLRECIDNAAYAHLRSRDVEALAHLESYLARTGT